MADGSGSGWLGRLWTLVLTVVVVSIALDIFARTLCRLMPWLIIGGLAIGTVWLVWRFKVGSRDRW